MAAAPMPLPLFSLCRTEKLLHGLFRSCVWRQATGKEGREEGRKEGREEGRGGLDWIGPCPPARMLRPTDRMSAAKLKMVPLRETFSFRRRPHPFRTDCPLLRANSACVQSSRKETGRGSMFYLHM